jgi:alcohol dehydrogenase
MKAAVFREYSSHPNKVVKIEDIDMPKIKSNEVLIKVEAAAHNYDDLWAIFGKPIEVPLPHISGTDVAGSVVEVGEDVQRIRVGDRIVSHANIACRVCSSCTSGKEYDCNDRLVWGFQTGPLWGGFAQYTHLPEVNVAKLPDNVSFTEAASISMVGMTSWHMLVRRAKIKPGQTVLIMGGTSGVGMVGIQIAKLFNCTVIATAGNHEKINRCIDIGADYAVNHREPDWYKKVKNITKSEGGVQSRVDVIFEHIGKSAFPHEVSLLKMGGTLVSTGATTGYESILDLRHLFFRGINILGSTSANKAELEQVIYWTSKGEIKPIIDKVMPFTQITDGFEMMLNGNHVGKIVNTPQQL